MKRLFEQARERIRVSLPANELTNEEALAFIRKYTAAIEGNFVAWMGAAAISARSVQGRYAASENLWVEMRDDHAGMLHAFARAANAEPTADDFASVAEAVASVRSMVAEMSGLKNLVLMAVLENTSAQFIPLLEKLAVQLGSTNLTYTKIHGEADVAHADQFLWAVEQEREHYGDADAAISSAIGVSVAFLEQVFLLKR